MYFVQLRIAVSDRQHSVTVDAPTVVQKSPCAVRRTDLRSCQALLHVAACTPAEGFGLCARARSQDSYWQQHTKHAPCGWIRLRAGAHCIRQHNGEPHSLTCQQVRNGTERPCGLMLTLPHARIGLARQYCMGSAVRCRCRMDSSCPYWLMHRH
jgi:hypothetical protein